MSNVFLAFSVVVDGHASVLIMDERLSSRKYPSNVVYRVSTTPSRGLSECSRM